MWPNVVLLVALETSRDSWTMSVCEILLDSFDYYGIVRRFHILQGEFSDSTHLISSRQLTNRNEGMRDQQMDLIQ